MRPALAKYICTMVWLVSMETLLLAQAAPREQAPSPAAPQTSGQHALPTVFFPMAEPQEMQMDHHGGDIPMVVPRFPRLGDSQRVVAGPVYQLEQLERLAMANNPTLLQARRAVEAMRGQQRQSGMYPNPTVGYRGDEIRGGTYGGGEQGFFVEQPIVLGGKLGLNRKVGAAEVKEQEAEAEAQRHRVENDVRTAYYHMLAAQEHLAVVRDLVEIAKTTVRVVHQLGNVGQADETEVLEAEAEEQRMEVNAEVAGQVLRRRWVALTSIVGAPALAEGSVAGRIDEALPPFEEPQLLASLLSESPNIASAKAEVQQAAAALDRAQHDHVPDLVVKGGLQQNFEQLGAVPGRQVGLQGFAEIGAHLHFWDRNQGGVAAARANLEAAQAEVTRVELALRRRFAAQAQNYQSSRQTSERYRNEILPRLQRAYALMITQYGEMTASFIRVLNLQRMLFENETAYIDALEHAWTGNVVLRGFLLEGSLDGPGARPGESSENEMEKMPAIVQTSGVF